MFRVRSSPTARACFRLTRPERPATWSASADAFSINDSFNQIQGSSAGWGRVQPSGVDGIIGTIKSPEWTEWNFSVQQQLNRSTVFTINYAGNHGARIVSNAWPNAFDSGYLGPTRILLAEHFPLHHRPKLFDRYGV